MIIRKLTDDEKLLSRTAKDEANYLLMDSRKKLTKQLSHDRSAYSHGHSKLTALEHQRDSIRMVQGFPVNLSLLGVDIVINYDFLIKWAKHLKPSDIISAAIDFRTGQPILHIRHDRYRGNKGSLELYPLPFYQQALLKDIPVICLMPA